MRNQLPVAQHASLLSGRFLFPDQRAGGGFHAVGMAVVRTEVESAAVPRGRQPHRSVRWEGPFLHSSSCVQATNGVIHGRPTHNRPIHPPRSRRRRDRSSAWIPAGGCCRRNPIWPARSKSFAPGACSASKITRQAVAPRHATPCLPGAGGSSSNFSPARRIGSGSRSILAAAACFVQSRNRRSTSNPHLPFAIGIGPG